MLLALLWAAGFVWFMLQIPTQENSSTERVDAVVVLTGGAGRINHGLQRMKEGKAEQIFISGVNDAATAEHIIKQTVAQDAPEMLDTKHNEMVLGYEATSTIGNADEVSAWVKKNKVHSIRLVTANYHMPRSLYEFHQVMPSNLIIMPDPVFPKDFALKDWWRMGNSSDLLLSEYHKLLAAYLRHRLIAWHKKL
jgi:uncharacterized SAM-binding protein YcdF (DUF218 family)